MRYGESGIGALLCWDEVSEDVYQQPLLSRGPIWG